MSEVEKMTLFSERKDANKSNTSSKIPSWINLGAEESTSIYFFVSPEKCEVAFEAVKNSTLPQEVIADLTAGGTFKKVLTRAGFGVGHTSGEDTTLQGFIFKEVLGEYNEDFLKIIAPFVMSCSYIELRDMFGDRYRWLFDGSTCKKIFPKLLWE